MLISHTLSKYKLKINIKYSRTELISQYVNLFNSVPSREISTHIYSKSTTETAKKLMKYVLNEQ